MSRYIDVNKVKLKGIAVFDENLDALIPLSEVRKALELTPTADVAEVRHGYWAWDTGEKRCSVCGVKCPEDEYNYLHPQYCPNCGADMRGTDDGI